MSEANARPTIPQPRDGLVSELPAGTSVVAALAPGDAWLPTTRGFKRLLGLGAPHGALLALLRRRRSRG